MATSLAGGLGLWAFNAEAWSAGAITLCIAVGICLTRITPALAQTIRDVGKAWVDVLKYKKQMLEDSVPILTEVKAVTTENKSAIRDIMAEQRAKEQRIIDLEAKSTRLEAENAALRSQVGGLGEATLIQTGDMRDPAKENLR